MSGEVDAADVAFGRAYGLISVITQASLVAFVLFVRPTPEYLGEAACGTAFLMALPATVLAWVLAAKHVSGRPGAVLSLPRYADPVRGDPTRGPLLRRLVLRFKRLAHRLAPVRRLAAAATVLAASWGTVVYLCVCFGAPAFSLHQVRIGDTMQILRVKVFICSIGIIPRM